MAACLVHFLSYNITNTEFEQSFSFANAYTLNKKLQISVTEYILLLNRWISYSLIPRLCVQFTDL
jgi:hypothetical protein